MRDQPLGGDSRHHFIGVADAFAAIEAERESERVQELVAVGGAWRIRHLARITPDE